MNFVDEIITKLSNKFTISQITPIDDGINTLYSATTSNNAIIIKIGTHDPESVKVEPYIINRLQEHNIPTPKIRHTGTVKNYPFFVSEKIHGKQLQYPDNITTDYLEQISYNIGMELANIHIIACDESGRFTVKNNELHSPQTDWKTFYLTLLDTFAEESKKNFGELGSRAKEILYQIDMPPVDSPSLNPLDLHTRNVFVNNSDEIIGLIDFERIYGGNPRWSFDVTLSALLQDRRNNTKIKKRFKQGYSNIRPIPNKHRAFALGALLREMQAAHIWWQNPKRKESDFTHRLEKINKNQI